MKDYAKLMERISILTNDPRVNTLNHEICREQAHLMKENEYLYRRLSADTQPQDGSNCHFQPEIKSKSGGESPKL